MVPLKGGLVRFNPVITPFAVRILGLSYPDAVAPDNFVVHSNCVCKVSPRPKMITPQLLSYMLKLVVEMNSCAPFQDAHQR